MESEGFQLVKKKKAARPRSKQVIQDVVYSPQHSKSECLDKIQLARQIIETSEGHSSLKKNLDSIEKELNTVLTPHQNIKVSGIVCYGLGQLSSSRIARYQGALLLILKDHFQVPAEVYDPIFSAVDVEVLEVFDIKVLNRNEEGKRKVVETTLFFLPHCGKELYNNLLWTNWNPSLLSRCVIVGNSFSTIVQNVPTRTLKEHYMFIYQAQDMFKELPLTSLVDYDDVFNDVNIHIPCHNILNKSPEFWLENKEPKYENCDVEIVRKKMSEIKF
ncbi:SRR1-like protein [Scylla paramamosain]|uniref:SRR1-like protein n=1 Tax=Scylla paramamosain TaxID=85552 RepID=UPI003083C797